MGDPAVGPTEIHEMEKGTVLAYLVVETADSRNCFVSSCRCWAKCPGESVKAFACFGWCRHCSHLHVGSFIAHASINI